MSKEQAKEFFYEVAKNKELAEKVSQLVGSAASKEAVAKKLISVAKEHGFNFTKEEAAIAQRDFKIPLSEEDLEEVSGGSAGLFIAAVAFVLSFFAEAGYLASRDHQTSSSRYHVTNMLSDVNDEDMDELHPAMFDAQAEDEDNNAEENDEKEENDTDHETSENDYDKDSNPLLKTIRDEKMYGESPLKPFWSSFLDSRAGVKEETGERQLTDNEEHQSILKRLKEERMNEMRYVNVVLSPGGGSGGGNDDDDFKKQLQREAENLRKKTESFKRDAYADFVPSDAPVLFSDLKSALANLKVELPEKLTSDTQTYEKTDDITESKIDEQKPVEQQ